MLKRHFLGGTLLLFAAVCPANQNDSANNGSWSGVIINSGCTVDEAFAEAAKCTVAKPDSKLVLYDDTIRQIYELDPPLDSPEADRLGDAVNVRGKLGGNTIHEAVVKPLTSFGLDVGQKAPSFSAPDQFGREQTLETLRGSNGTVLLFFRSADWCPYCKGQLIQLQNAKARFGKQGIRLAGISYDNEAILKSFADRRKIEFPLLADPDSQVIRAYDVLNSEAIGQNKGMSRPGYFFIDPKGVIREKFFLAKYRDRLTGNSVLANLFPALGDEVTDDLQAPHLQLALGQSDRIGVPGNFISVTAEVRLPKDVHVYAPGTKGYKPIRLSVEPSGDFELRHPTYPQAKTLYLPTIKERVPVFEGTFRIRQELRVSSTADFLNSLGDDGKTLTIKGKLDYQACDNKICFLPASVPVEWRLQILALDRQRAPDDVRHK